jgi:hypothetical protein
MEVSNGAMGIVLAQNDDICGVEIEWPTGGDPWRFDGSSKRRAGDKRDRDLGRNLATLRALRKLVRRLEREIGPEAFDKPKPLPDVVVTVRADTSAFDAAIAKLQADIAAAPADDLPPGTLVTSPGAASTAMDLKRSNLFVWTGGSVYPNARWFDTGEPCYLDPKGLVKVDPIDVHRYVYKAPVVSAIRCVRVDPPVKPSRRDVIAGVVADPRDYKTLPDRINDALEAWEAADNPAPTYRIELDAEAFEALYQQAVRYICRGHVVGATYKLLEAVWQCKARPNDGEGLAEVDVPRTADEQFAYETIKGWAESAASAPVEDARSSASGLTYTPDPYAEAKRLQSERTVGTAGATDSSGEAEPESAVKLRGRAAPGWRLHVDPGPVERCDKAVGDPWGSHCVRPIDHGWTPRGHGTETVGCSNHWQPEDGPEPAQPVVYGGDGTVKSG